jgi:hypothetical protein
MKRCLLFSTVVIAMWAVGSSAWASPAFITYAGAGAQTQVAADGSAAAPGSSTNYDFTDFTNGTAPEVLNNFTVNTALAAGQYTDGGFTLLQAPGGGPAFTTGMSYQLGPGDQRVATFQSTSAANFSVYVLDANSGGTATDADADVFSVGNTTVGLGVSDVSAGDDLTTAATSFTSGHNEFTRFDITGASPSETFYVYANPGTNDIAEIGGLTFSITAPPAGVPEPSSIVALFGLGAMGLFFAARRMNKAA